MVSTEILGFIGTTLIFLAYIPQITHLIKEKDSKGISIKAWGLWAVAGVLLLIHAIAIKDSVFITLQAINLIAISIIIVLAVKYKKR